MNNKILSDTISLTFVRITTTILGLICIRIISEAFSLNEYGTYSQAMLIVSSLTAFSILGFTDAANYFFNKNSENKEEQIQYISTIITLQYIIGGVCGICIILFQQIISHFFQNPELQNMYKWIAFIPLCMNLISIQQVLFISLKKAKQIALRNFIVSVLRLIIFIIGCYITHDIKTIIILTLLSDIGQVLYFKYLLKRENYNFRLIRLKRPMVKSIFAFGIPMSIYIISNSLMRDCDKYVISYFTNTTTLALYTNASKLLPFDLLTTSFATVLLPYITQSISKDQKQQALNYISKYINFSFIFTWIIIMGAILCSKDLILLLYGEKYVSGLSIFIIYLFVTLIRFANMSIIFSAAGNTKIIMILSIILLIANIILSIMMIKLMGPIGCAFATLIVSIIGNGYIFIKAKDILGKSLFAVLDWKIYIKLLLYTLLIGGGIYIIKENSSIISSLPIFFSIGIPYCIFVAGLLFIFKRKLLSYIKNIG